MVRFSEEKIFSNQFDESANKYNNIRFDATVLDMICRYLVSDNRNIKHKGYSNIRTFFQNINPKDYNDDVRREKLEFIERALDARLDFNLSTKDAVLSHIASLGERLPYDLAELSNDEVIWIDAIIEKALTYTYVYRAVPRLKNLISDLEHCDPTKRDIHASNLIECMQGIITEHRQSVIEHDSETYFSLAGPQCRQAVSEYHSTFASPSNKLRLGVKKLNEFMNGGLESGRVYNLIGVPSDGKSLTLVDFALQIKNYNRDYRPKDLTKIPTVVILTMENACRETFERIIKMIYGPCDLKNFTVDQLMDILAGKGLCVSPDNPINIVVKYKPNLSVTTDYYYELYDELLMNGMEMICLIHDYTKRIKSSFPAYNSADDRIRLGAIINEDKAFAICKNIPLITASQFNREGMKIVEEARNVNASNIVSKLNRYNIGESALIIENSDCAYAIAYEWKYLPNGEREKWMGFKDLKSRNGEANIEMVYIPYSYVSPIKLAEDVGTNHDCAKYTMIESGGNTFTYNSPDGILKTKGVNEYGYLEMDKLDPEYRPQAMMEEIEEQKRINARKGERKPSYFDCLPIPQEEESNEYTTLMDLSNSINNTVKPKTITIDMLFVGRPA